MEREEKMGKKEGRYRRKEVRRGEEKKREIWREG